MTLTTGALGALAAAFIAFAITWLAAFFVRFFNAPVLICEEAENRHSQARVRVAELEERLIPKITVSLDETCAGIRVVKTQLVLPPGAPPQRGPDSKWVQIIVMSATNAPLVNCEARLMRAERIDENGVVTAILTEPLFCTWSNTSVSRMTIPPSVPHAANIFSARDGFTELYIETLPVKLEFRDEIQRPGTYRLKIGVSAQDCPTNVKTFLFEWGGSYNSNSITQE